MIVGYVYVFVAGIEFQNIILEGGKVSVLYFVAIEAELHKNLSKTTSNASNCDNPMFTPLEGNNFKQILKL